MDIGLNDQFDIELDGRQDLPLVTGRAKFEQRLRISVTEFFTEVVGETDRPAALRLIEKEAKQVARRFEEIERAIQILVDYDDDQPNTIELTVIYDTGDEFSFPISE
jgi:hypothetical protein